MFIVIKDSLVIQSIRSKPFVYFTSNIYLSLSFAIILIVRIIVFYRINCQEIGVRTYNNRGQIYTRKEIKLNQFPQKEVL